MKNKTSENIFLIGFMGSGKSFYGRNLAKALDMELIDLDVCIAEETGQTINQIFEEQGEAAFRELEKKHLRSLRTDKVKIISVGGGTPCFFDNMEWMNANGKTVYLKCAASLLFIRLRKSSKRPLLLNKSPEELSAFIEAKLLERESFYAKAKVIHFQQDGREKNLEDLIKYFESVS